MVNVSFLLIITSIANFILGLLVYIRNTRNYRNTFFFLLATAVGGWALGLGMFLLSINQQTALFWGKVFYISALSIAISLFLFAKHYSTPYKINKSAILATFPALTYMIYIFLVPDFLTASVNLNSTNNEIILNSNHYFIYSILFLFYFTYAILVLYKIRLSSKNKETITQLNVVLGSLLIAGVFGVIFNLILPWLGNYELIWIGPLFSIVFVSAISYSIIKYKLFSFKLIVTRSLAYILTLLLLSIVFLIVINSISTLFFKSENTDTNQFLYLLIALIVALSFQPLKAFFDKVSNRIFYRDHYEIHKILDELGAVIVAEIEIIDLMTKSLSIIEKYLKPTEGIAVLLDDTGDFYDDFNINQKIELAPTDFIEVDDAQNETILQVDNYDITSIEQYNTETQNLIRFLKKHNIYISVRLNTKDQIVGYLLLGPKMSGDTYNKDDLQFLNIAASEMAVSIQNARRFDEIQRFNETLRLEVDRATKEMRESNRKLRELDEAKDDFITMASHQLRTPLTSVKGYVSMVMEGDAGKVTQKQKDLLNAAYSSAQRMVYLIGDLLNASRLKTGKFIIETREVNMPSIIDSEIEQLQATAKTRGIKLIFKKPKKFPQLMLDENKIRQVIMNYIDNAIYYTTAGGKIVIELSATKKKIDFTVKDTGIGVPENEKHKLFSKFYRADNARAARPDGTGLGLFMAKKAVVAQGGAILFESEEGKGSTFGFTFPLSRVEVKPENSNKKKKLSATKNKPKSTSAK